MSTEETKDKKEKARCADFGCTPENFKKMFEMMEKCCPGQGDSMDCSAMMGGMMKGMTEMCCEPKTDKTKAD
jgi:hypothetical protein